MNVHQDGLTLDRAFPFQINEVSLSDADNADEAFHWHEFLEITCILEGSGCYYVNDRAYEVQPGDVIIFNNDELHGCQIGLVNYADRLDGVQIGLLNFARSQWFFPFINIGW